MRPITCYKLYYSKHEQNFLTHIYNTRLWVAGPYSELTIVNGQYHAPSGIRSTVIESSLLSDQRSTTKPPRLDSSYMFIESFKAQFIYQCLRLKAVKLCHLDFHFQPQGLVHLTGPEKFLTGPNKFDF